MVHVLFCYSGTTQLFRSKAIITNKLLHLLIVIITRRYWHYIIISIDICCVWLIDVWLLQLKLGLGCTRQLAQSTAKAPGPWKKEKKQIEKTINDDINADILSFTRNINHPQIFQITRLRYLDLFVFNSTISYFRPRLTLTLAEKL